jgi:hypothetical protein
LPIKHPYVSRTLAAAILLAGAGAIAPAGAVEVRTFGEVSYVTGGIGVQSREEIMSARGQYNLRLLFAYTSGSYLADIAVTVADQAGRILLETVSNGPYLWARIAPGRYRVTVSHAGEAQTRQANVPASGAVDLSFFWAPPD